MSEELGYLSFELEDSCSEESSDDDSGMGMIVSPPPPPALRTVRFQSPRQNGGAAASDGSASHRNYDSVAALSRSLSLARRSEVPAQSSPLPRYRNNGLAGTIGGPDAGAGVQRRR